MMSVVESPSRQAADSDLGALKVLQKGNGTTGCLGNSTKTPRDLGMVGVAAMGEIETRHIHTCLHKLTQLRL